MTFVPSVYIWSKFTSNIILINGNIASRKTYAIVFAKKVNRIRNRVLPKRFTSDGSGYGHDRNIFTGSRDRKFPGTFSGGHFDPGTHLLPLGITIFVFDKCPAISPVRPVYLPRGAPLFFANRKSFRTISPLIPKTLSPSPIPSHLRLVNGLINKLS